MYENDPNAEGLGKDMWVAEKFVKGPCTEGLGEGTWVTLVMKHVCRRWVC